jgi:hypothetical protein
MHELFNLLLSPILVFAWQPLYILCVLVLMLLPCLFNWHKKFAKVLMTITILPWVLFMYTEATIPVSSNIRVDLAILGPIYLLSVIIWVIIFITGRLR